MSKKCFWVALIVLLLAISALVSCSSDAASEGTKPLEISLTKTTTVGSREINGEIWYLNPVELKLTVNQSADITVRFDYPDGDTQEKTYKDTSVSVTLDKDCSVVFSVRTNNRSEMRSEYIRFLNLVPVDLNSWDDTSTTDGVMSLNIGSTIYFSYFDTRFGSPEDVKPLIRYTTDGSDPHTSDTATEFIYDGSGFSQGIVFDGTFTKIRAYASLEGWNPSDETIYELLVNKTANPTVSPDGEGDIIIPFGESIMVSGHGTTWFTTNDNLTVDDIEPDAGYTDSSLYWVVCNGIISMDGISSMSVRIVSKEEGKLFSDIVTKTFKVQLRPPVEDGDRVTDGDYITLTFSRNSNPSDSTVTCIVNGYSWSVTELSGGRFSIKVNSGSSMSVSLSKAGYIKSETLSTKALVKLNKPSCDTSLVTGKKYKKVSLASSQDATIKYILNGEERTYNSPIEIRETTTLSYWAEKDEFENSDVVNNKITVSYSVGDIGPAGGVIVHDGYGYIELYTEAFSPLPFGYYSTKEGSVRRVFGSNDPDSDSVNAGAGKDNTEILVDRMTGHAYATNKAKASDKLNNFVAKAASQFSVNQTINGRTVVFDDWYLPSRNEMVMIFNRASDPEIKSKFLWFASDLHYWTSTENGSYDAYYVYSYYGTIKCGTISKGSNYYYVVMRKF